MSMSADCLVILHCLSLLSDGWDQCVRPQPSAKQRQAVELTCMMPAPCSLTRRPPFGYSLL